MAQALVVPHTPRPLRNASACSSLKGSILHGRPVIEDQEYTSIRPLIDWLDYNGYTVVTKEFIDASGRRKVKGNIDIELAVDAMELAERGGFSQTANNDERPRERAGSERDPFTGVPSLRARFRIEGAGGR